MFFFIHLIGKCVAMSFFLYSSFSLNGECFPSVLLHQFAIVVVVVFFLAFAFSLSYRLFSFDWKFFTLRPKHTHKYFVFKLVHFGAGTVARLEILCV